jgi:hypothetical protein
MVTGAVSILYDTQVLITQRVPWSGSRGQPFAEKFTDISLMLRKEHVNRLCKPLKKRRA